MKFDSPLFDRIRVRRPREEDVSARAVRECDWAGCDRPGTHRAPKGRGHEGEYWHYCLDHVRAYNANYNYFAGLNDDAVAAYQKDAVTGHRPTWRMGMNGARRSGAEGASATGADQGFSWHDPFGFFDAADRGAQARREIPEGRQVRNAERKAFETLGLEIDATAAEIKAKFKEQVKRHHPDSHGGDRSYEDRLRAVIQAYNYLKAAGFC
ncbi:MAG: DnaJ domain-containing protein [Bradyrhizobiaceae bacterium]|nr:DnaJ domain-containing protein [Bradyrhizobiaceae bacterium]